MSSRNAKGSRGHSSRQHRDLPVTEAEFEALSLSSEQLAISSRRTPSVAEPSPYNLGLFPEASSSTVGGAALGLGGQLSTSERDWQSSFSFEEASGRHNTSFLPADNTSALDFNTSSYPLAAEQEIYHSDLMHSNIRDYNWANMPTFPGQQFPRNIGQPLSRPEDFPLLNSPAGFNPHQSNENFIPPESQLTPSPSYPMSTSVRTPSKQHSLSPSTPYTFNQPPYDIPHASFASPYPVSTTPESRVPTTAAAPPPPPPVSPRFSPSGSASGSPGPENQVRVISSRPKPQCWDHGCNGREFSTFSNLLRHQRERSGASAKAECPHCGAVFTRTTARNTHIAQGKCKGAGRGSVDTD